MPDGLYERDVLLWAEQQASLLRRLAASERLDEAIDWPHLIEEVQDVGISARRACQSLLRQSLLHLLDLATWPESPPAARWRSKTLEFCTRAGSAMALYLPCSLG